MFTDLMQDWQSLQGLKHNVCYLKPSAQPNILLCFMPFQCRLEQVLHCQKAVLLEIIGETKPVQYTAFNKVI